MATTAWKNHESLIVFGIVLIGSLFAFSTAKEEAVKSGTVIGIDLGTTDSCVDVYKNGYVEIIANDQGNKITTSYEEAVKLGTVIGIDLGTTYSCVGVYKNGLVEIITDDQGNKITPSWVGFTDSEILIGEAAKNQSAVNPERTIFDVKRLIGRKFEDKEVQRVMKLVPYKVVNKDGKPYIQIKVKDGETRAFSPEEISAMILTKMKETAEAYLGKEIKDVVITVPAYFNEAQKQATKDAGIIAGLNVARIIDEPTAAAIAYGLDRQQQGERNILVIDLGGGTFDVSILTTEYGVLEVLSTNGDTHLGGPLTRAPRFEELNNDDLFKKTILGPVNKAMEDAGLEKDEIDEIVLVGGGKNTMIPNVEELLKNYFNGKQPRKCLNPDEAVAIGAAVQGGILSGDVLDQFTDVGLGPPMYPLPTLGIETVGGVMTKLIDRNTFIPTKKSQLFTTCQDRQTTVSFKVYEVYKGGHSQVLTKDCRLLGTFNLSGIPPAPRGTPRIEVTFSVDVDGILNVKAKDKASGKSENITITGGLSEEEINRMVHEAEEFAEEDRKLKEKIDSRNTLETYIYNMRSQINDKDKLANKLETDEKARIENATKEALEWIDDNQGVEKKEYVEKLKEVEGVCNPIVTSVYQRSVRGESSFARRVVDFFIFIIILFYYYSLFYYDN